MGRDSPTRAAATRSSSNPSGIKNTQSALPLALLLLESASARSYVSSPTPVTRSKRDPRCLVSARERSLSSRSTTITLAS